MEIEQEITEVEITIKKGRFIEAYNLLNSKLVNNPDNIRLLQLKGLVLAKIGEPIKAKDHMESIYKVNKDPETSGILGRIYKDLFKKTNNPEYGQKSREIYRDCFRKEKDYYNGINAATMSFAVGDKAEAVGIAQSVIDIIMKNDCKDYWSLATLGEAYLIINDPVNAFHYYEEAVKTSSESPGNVNSSYHQILFLKNIISIPADILNILKPKPIVVFSGHMIDHPDRVVPRFPETISVEIKKDIKHRLQEIDAGIGYSSLACGSDILFVEAMLERGAEVNVYLPFQKDDFIEKSVGFAGQNWVDRFNKILEKTRVNYITEERYLGSDELFSFLNRIILGQAQVRSKSLQAEYYMMGVFHSSKKNIKTGGTEEFFKKYKGRNNIIIIDPKKYISRDKTYQNKPISITGNDKSAPPFGLKRFIKSILFSDIKGFSKLNEEQMPYFMHVLLNKIAVRINNFRIRPYIVNTWGDAIFSVFSSPLEAAEYAVILRNIFRETRWSEFNLPENINIRIALHTGPIFVARDPITGKMNAYGSHVNRAARIEPVTVPGSIYATDQFTTLLMLDYPEKYKYEYVGIIDLAKGFGKQEIYNIIPADEKLN